MFIFILQMLYLSGNGLSVKFDWYEREIINGITVYITW